VSSTSAKLQKFARTVAVGMAVASHPPHRPVLAALPHTVLTLDGRRSAAGVKTRVWKCMNNMWCG
jgi:hypothetical protein